MLNGLNNIVNFLNGYIWGVGMLVLIVGSGLYFTIRLHGFQFVHFKDMWSRIIDKQDSDWEFRHSVRSVRLWQCVSVQET